MERFLAERAPEVAFYSEDRGLVIAGRERAEWVLVVDPIDGTRPGDGRARVGVRVGRRSRRSATASRRWATSRSAASSRSRCGRPFVAERGAGRRSGARPVGEHGCLERMFWTYGLRGRPVRRVAEVLGELIDSSSVGGGTFDLGSATYDMTRVVTGQLDAYVEPGSRMIADVPGMREEFERVGGGAVLNNSPYDLAAAVLICEEAGAVVTDAYGEAARAERRCWAPAPSSRSPA